MVKWLRLIINGRPFVSLANWPFHWLQFVVCLSLSLLQLLASFGQSLLITWPASSITCLPACCLQWLQMDHFEPRQRCSEGAIQLTPRQRDSRELKRRACQNELAKWTGTTLLLLVFRDVYLRTLNELAKSVSSPNECHRSLWVAIFALFEWLDAVSGAEVVEAMIIYATVGQKLD